MEPTQCKIYKFQECYSIWLFEEGSLEVVFLFLKQRYKLYVYKLTTKMQYNIPNNTTNRKRIYLSDLLYFTSA